MATGSTASSPTDPPDGDEPAQADEAEAESAPPGPLDADDAPASAPTVDVERRAFFRSFGREALKTAGQVAGMASIVSSTGSSAAAELLGIDRAPSPARTPPTRRGRRPIARRRIAEGEAADDTFRSPYRLEGDELILLDHRTIPEALDELVCRRGSDVAYHLRTGAVTGSPLMAQLAAYGLALTAAERADKPAAARDSEIRRTREALVAARAGSRPLAWSMERLAAVASEHPEDGTGADLAAALRRAADAIALRVQADHTAISRHLAELLPTPEGRPLGVLVHGAPGALAGGGVGTVLSALIGLAEAERDLTIHITETRPFLDGLRLAGAELRRHDVAFRVIPDGAVGWLLSSEPVDVVLLAPERIAADGATAAVVGSRSIALQLRALRAGSPLDTPRLIVVGSTIAIDAGAADAAALPLEPRPPRTLGEFLEDVPVRAGEAVVPGIDIIDAADIDTFVTEHGPVEAAGIAALAGDGSDES